jgi:hypothetical protein
MDHRGVADRCPIYGCCVTAAATRHAVRRNTTSPQRVSFCCRSIVAAFFECFPINITVSDSLGKAAQLLIDREGKLSRLNEASSVAARLSDS